MDTHFEASKLARADLRRRILAKDWFVMAEAGTSKPVAPTSGVDQGQSPIPVPSPEAALAAAGAQGTVNWNEQLMQYYKQTGAQPNTFYPTMAATHPYANLAAASWQPYMAYGQMYPNLFPFGYAPPTSAPGTTTDTAAVSVSAPPSGQAAPPALPLGQAAPVNGVTATASPTEKVGANPVKEVVPAAEATVVTDVSDKSGTPKQNGSASVPATFANSDLGTSTSAAALAALAANPAAAVNAEYWRQHLAGQQQQPDLQQLAVGQAVLDERELKRQRRKQSNRESARRSRLRKQAECEGLSSTLKESQSEMDKLKADNDELRAQVLRLKEELAVARGEKMQ